MIDIGLCREPLGDRAFELVDPFRLGKPHDFVNAGAVLKKVRHKFLRFGVAALIEFGHGSPPFKEDALISVEHHGGVGLPSGDGQFSNNLLRQDGGAFGTTGRLADYGTVNRNQRRCELKTGVKREHIGVASTGGENDFQPLRLQALHRLSILLAYCAVRA